MLPVVKKQKVIAKIIQHKINAHIKLQVTLPAFGLITLAILFQIKIVV